MKRPSSPAWFLLLSIGVGVSLSSPGLTEARLIPIADSAWAGSSVNVVANVRQAVFTHEDVQFAAYYDADGVMVLARRRIDAERWETRRTAHAGHVADAHNSISLVVDGAGVLHVAWDHHDSLLTYARGIAPGSLELGPKEAMTGEREARVTYPQFFRLPGGDVLFLYRDGASGRGTLVLKRYSVAARAWTTVQANLVDGEGVRSPYWDMTVDRAGTLHLAWTWRESPDVATNHDLCYARSPDEGRTWTRSDGTPATLPITAGTAEYAARIPPRSNLMNPPAITTNDSGRPLITSYWSPSPAGLKPHLYPIGVDAPPRFHVVHHDGTRWQTIAGPARTNAFTLSGAGTRRPPISRAVALVEPGGAGPRLHLVYRDDARGSAPRIVAATLESAGSGVWNERELTAEPVGAWEPAIDPAAWARLGQAHMLVQEVVQRDGDDRVAAATPPTPIALLVWEPGR